MAFKIRQNPFSAGALPRTPLGELPTLPRPPSPLERGHPSQYPTPFGTDPSSALAMRPPQNFSQIDTYGLVVVMDAHTASAVAAIVFLLSPEGASSASLSMGSSSSSSSSRAGPMMEHSRFHGSLPLFTILSSSPCRVHGLRVFSRRRRRRRCCCCCCQCSLLIVCVAHVDEEEHSHGSSCRQLLQRQPVQR